MMGILVDIHGLGAPIAFSLRPGYGRNCAL